MAEGAGSQMDNIKPRVDRKGLTVIEGGGKGKPALKYHPSILRKPVTPPNAS